MYCITDAQIDWVLNDFRARGIKLDSLQQDLLDHVCCIIEQELEDNGDFERFYERTISTFYKESLDEIEKETTLLLTFKNYYAMKKIMIVSGTTSAFAFLLGSMFKIQHWPGAGILLLLGIITFSFVFLPLMYVFKTRDNASKRDKVVFGIGTLLGIMYCLSMLFQMMHWPGARILWISTLMIGFFVFLPLYFLTGIRQPETKFNTIVSSILLVAMMGTQFMLTAMRPSGHLQSRSYSYLQSEELLKHFRSTNRITPKTAVAQNLATQIQDKCQDIKRLVLLGSGVANEREIVKERTLQPDFFTAGEGLQKMSELKALVAQYNSLQGSDSTNIIPVNYSILDVDYNDQDFRNNLFVLNSLTQLQLYLAGNTSQTMTAAR